MSLTVETHNDLANPQRAKATRVVVYDQNNNPIAVVVEVGDQFIISTIENAAEFNTVLHQLGIRQTVVVETARQQPLRDIQFR